MILKEENDEMIYLASPFTSKSLPTDDENKQLEYDRFLLVLKATAHLTNQGWHIFSPIVHSYWMSVHHQLPGDWQFWEALDRNFISRSDELWILGIDGWGKSTGVMAEVKIAGKLGKPVRMVHPESYEVYDIEVVGRAKTQVQSHSPALNDLFSLSPEK